MAENVNQHILAQYDATVHLYDGLAKKARDLVEEMLREADIRFHSVTSRVKKRDSLSKKIAKENKDYHELNDLTDIAGVRVITYFEDDVDKVAERIEGEFTIDRTNTVDKRKGLAPDRFGYQTMQHIAKMDSGRTRYFEYARFDGLKFEIQTRSILQHAWAEMEHDLGYKNPESIPRQARRRFSRLAGLLEIADDEFVRLRDELEAYRREVPQRIEADPQEVEIDKDSLTALYRASPLIQALDNEISLIAGVPLIDYSENETSIVLLEEKDVKLLQLLQIRTVEEVEAALRENRDELTAFVRNYWAALGERSSGAGHFTAGVSILYLIYFLAGKTLERDKIVDLLDAVWTTPQRELSERLATRISEAYAATSD
jgi:putative GTP pyrophosphokinase